MIFSSLLFISYIFGQLTNKINYEKSRGNYSKIKI